MRPQIDRAPTKDLERGIAALRRGRVPLLCWDDHEMWVVARPRTTVEAQNLRALQMRRGIRAAYLVGPDAEQVLSDRALTLSPKTQEEEPA